MLSRDQKQGMQTCLDCGENRLVGRLVSAYTRAAVLGRQHGTRRLMGAWNCPLCGRSLGCDECAGRFASDMLCNHCRGCADGSPVITLTCQERQLPIEMLLHVVPSCAIRVNRLAHESCAKEIEIKEMINVLWKKRVYFGVIDDLYELRPHLDPKPGSMTKSIPGLASNRHFLSVLTNSPKHKTITLDVGGDVVNHFEASPTLL